MEDHIGAISHAIQLAVAPVFLLTALSTLMNVLHGRLARIVDRRRVLDGRLGPDGGDVDGPDRQEMVVLDSRGSLIYKAIFSTVLSALLVCLVVASAFLGAMASADTARLVAILFVLAMLAMILGLGFFLREIYLAVQTGGHRRR